ncbi:PAH-inducible cytochrome P450 monooxygenase PC-PAH 4 [Trametes polyzona]|nr:PAH-inducible cytochrome P450 monooxygenase PC-PAH 4 [Trametes polyzona]
MLSLSAAVCAALALVLVLLRVFKRRNSIRHVRGPARFASLLGHEYLMTLQDDAGDLELQWLKEYGPTWRIQGAFGGHDLMTADPKALQHIFHKSAYMYCKKPSQNHMSYLLGGPGIVWAQGETHQRHRKVMYPAFNANHLRSFLPLFQRITSKLADKWRAELSTTSEVETAMNNWLSRATLDIIGRAAFDFDYGALDDVETSAIAKAYHGILKDAEYKLGAPIMIFRATWDYLPEWFLKLFQYIPMYPFTRMLNLRRLFDEYGKQILREKGPEVDMEKQTRSKDVMSILVKANNSSDAKTRLDDEEIMAEMYTLTLAGHETTAGTFTFLLYELARHPEYQARMRQEIKDARARVVERGGMDLTMEDLDNMPVCLNAIKVRVSVMRLNTETLRFHPIVTTIPRVATKDDVIPLAYPIVSVTGETITEIPVSKGQNVVCSFVTYNRLPQIWGEDADVWNPDRFSRIDASKQVNVGVFANVMTFSAGIRGCIGWRFSVIEMQALAAGLVEIFQFSLPAGAKDTNDPKNSEVQYLPSGGTMVPVLRGKPELGPYLRLRVSLVQPQSE